MIRIFFVSLVICVSVVRGLHRANFATRADLRNTRRNCWDYDLTPISKTGVRGDSDSSWRTTGMENIQFIEREKFDVRPDLLTFDAYNTLIQPSQSIGKWYREVLNNACDMAIRLPRPSFFTEGFKIAYAAKNEKHPCFGAKDGMTSREWWTDVIRETYLNTKLLTEVDPDELEQLLPELVDALYSDVFGSKEGWVLKEDVIYTLEKLKDWRDMGNGPKIGVLSNFDDRLPVILADLGIAEYFDFIMTSFDAKESKPNTGIFEKALREAGVTDFSACYHIGDEQATDVAGSIAAGWNPVRYREWFDEDFPDWTEIDNNEEAAAGAARRREFLRWGRKDVKTGQEWTEIWGLDDILSLFGFPEDPDKAISTVVLKGIYEDS